MTAPVEPTPIAPGPVVPTSADPEATFDAQFEAFLSWQKNELQPGANALAAATYANALAAAEEAQTAWLQANAAASSAEVADAARLAAQDAQVAAEAAVATIPEGTINDETTSLTGVWSSTKTSSELAGKASTGANTYSAAQDLPSGTAIASAATVNLDAATGNRVHITGSVTITAVTLARGPRTVIFDGVLTLTHHATNNNLPGGANILTAAGDRAIYESDGTTVYCVSYIKASGMPPSTVPYLHVRHEVSAGINAGVATSPAQRTLNTVVANTIAGASLASSIITLPAGTYDVIAAAPSYGGVGPQKGKLVLYNNTDAVDLLVGQSAFVECNSYVGNIWADVRGRFTLAASKALILRHYATFSSGTDASGTAANLGSKNEVYAEAQFWKVA